AEGPLRLCPGGVYLPGSQIGAPATQWPFAVGRGDAMQSVTRGVQHAFGGFKVLALEVSVEGISEDDQIAPVAHHRFGLSHGSCFPPRTPPFWQAATGRK